MHTGASPKRPLPMLSTLSRCYRLRARLAWLAAPHWCRFTGTIPDLWADSRYFMSLETMDLHDNLLEGTLPSVKWNKKNSFRSLQTLDLSQNQLSGEWAGERVGG